MTAAQPLEIELKLALPPAQAAAFVRRMARRRTLNGTVTLQGTSTLKGTSGAPVEQDLVTRYFDTPDFALGARGVALRVRRTLNGTSSGHWIQTLKTEGERQGGLSRRVEFEMPVGRGAPDWRRFPREAQAYVPAALRAQLAPAFETRFHRTAWLIKGRGGAQIEVALDVGEVRTLKGTGAGARSQPLCEIELELKAGDPDALFALALQWADAFDCLPFDISKAERGVRLAHGVEAEPEKSAPVKLLAGMSVEDGFAEICQGCLAQFQANLPGVLASDDIEYVHQARVALRRLRAALRLFRKVCALPDELLGTLRALAVALGPVRDWDVLLGETLPAIAPHHADTEAWQRGAAALEARRGEIRAAMRETVRRAHPGAWLLGMQRWLLQRGWRRDPAGRQVAEPLRFLQLSPLPDWARRALQKGHRPVVCGARGFATLAPAQRHALRIAIKRQRYATEFFEALFGPRKQARYLAALRDAQDGLGRANDAQIAAGLLASAPESGSMGDFVRGWLAALQADAADGGCAEPLRVCAKLAPYW